MKLMKLMKRMKLMKCITGTIYQCAKTYRNCGAKISKIPVYSNEHARLEIPLGAV